MQLFQPLEPEDDALIEQLPRKPTKENLSEFCSGYGEFADAACWREGWPFFREEVITPEGVRTFCSHEKEPYTDECYASVSAIIGRFFLSDPEYSARLCNALDFNHQSVCFSRIALSFVEEDRIKGIEAVRYCARATHNAVKDECYSFLDRVSAFVYHLDDRGRTRLCEALPPGSRQTCSKS